MRIFWSRSSHRSLSNAGASKRSRAQCASLSDILPFNPLSNVELLRSPIFLLCLHLLALSNFLPLQEEHAPDPLSHVLCYVALLSLSAVYLAALLANLVKVHRSRHRASNLRHPPSNPRWRNNRPVPRLTRMTQPRFFFAGFSASALLFLSPRSPLSLPFPRSSSWLRFFRVFFLFSLPLVLERVFSFFLHCCPPPLSFVARAARPIARNGLTVFVDDTKKGRGEGAVLFFAHRSRAINVKRPSPLLLPYVPSLLPFVLSSNRRRSN